jgi:leader peptidase (prepilin peptidase)/N-methyltransferase
VEFLNAFLFLLLFLKFGLSLEFCFYAPFTSAFIALFFIDWKNKILPDVITISGVIFGLGLSPFVDHLGIRDSLLGAACGFVMFFLVAFLYEKITGRDGMGGGDIKMIAMVGAFLGLKGVIATIFISSLLGAVFGLLLIIFFRKDFRYAVPFGCFIALGGLIFLFAGEEISHFYLRLIGIHG